MFKNNFMIRAAATAVIALSGCATQMAPVSVSTTDIAVLEKLASYAQKSSISMQRLAALQMDRANASGARSVEMVAPAGLEKPISISWNGPIEQLTKKVSEMTGYSYHGVIGSKPASSVMVSISVTNMSAFQVLSDAGAQAGSAADIVINSEQKQLAVKYPPTNSSGGYPAVR